MFGPPAPQTDGGIVAAIDGTLTAIASVLPGSLAASSPVSQTDRPSYPSDSALADRLVSSEGGTRSGRRRTRSLSAAPTLRAASQTSNHSSRPHAVWA